MLCFALFWGGGSGERVTTGLQVKARGGSGQEDSDSSPHPSPLPKRRLLATSRAQGKCFNIQLCFPGKVFHSQGVGVSSSLFGYDSGRRRSRSALWAGALIFRVRCFAHCLFVWRVCIQSVVYSACDFKSCSSLFFCFNSYYYFMSNTKITYLPW